MSFTTRSIITLEVADEGDKRISVAETTSAVRVMVRSAEHAGRGGRWVTFARVRDDRLSEFNTRPENIANIEAA